jgi:hypothetical protein
VVSFRPQPLYPPRKALPVLIREATLWVTANLDIVGKRTLLPLPGIEPHIIQPITLNFVYQRTVTHGREI